MSFTSERHARRNAYSRIKETCPAVEAAIEKAISGSSITDVLSGDAISSLSTLAFEAAREAGTEPLRAALINCENELYQVSEERDEAQAELKNAKQEIEELQERIDELKLEISNS